jgi:hypothetical protein
MYEREPAGAMPRDPGSRTEVCWEYRPGLARAACVVVILTLLLVACAGNTTPGRETTQRPTATPTPTPEPTATPTRTSTPAGNLTEDPRWAQALRTPNRAVMGVVTVDTLNIRAAPQLTPPSSVRPTAAIRSPSSTVLPVTSSRASVSGTGSVRSATSRPPISSHSSQRSRSRPTMETSRSTRPSSRLGGRTTRRRMGFSRSSTA